MPTPSRELVATVLVAPRVLPELEVALMTRDLWVWPMATAPICADGPRRAEQYRRRTLTAKRGAWDDAADWVPAWVSFGETWRDGDEPLPWSAHAALWDALAAFGECCRYRKWLSGVPRLPLPRGADVAADRGRAS
ncbi:hypothetical protein JQN72_09300 [Phycicoccus sp. CSK15P-2]|uniref:hypothetical protein n=1 Tax=Phycicoccus sp. CSK15P-2 TaxID=2807627 RepID=UPI00194F2937|nr:hypothetical protein [Phycicoccus sp. CSK15P-2]MBM6404435.1 hypothetical protein [Phycicoccus sp. CSK15P-2]